MSYAIIGFGKIGHALAKAFARNGIEVAVATTRDPKSFASDAAAIGPEITSPRPSRVEDWSRASTICSLPSLTRILPSMVAGESCSWRATMTAQQRRLVRLRKSSVSRRSNLAGFRKVDCLCRRAETAGVC